MFFDTPEPVAIAECVQRFLLQESHFTREACWAQAEMFSAELFRHYKPDPEVYLGAREMLRLPPGRVMLCAAHNSDLAAAQKLGLRTAFVPRPTEYGPHQTRDFAPEGEWDVVAESIEDLAGRMAA